MQSTYEGYNITIKPLEPKSLFPVEDVPAGADYVKKITAEQTTTQTKLIIENNTTDDQEIIIKTEGGGGGGELPVGLPGQILIANADGEFIPENSPYATSAQLDDEARTRARAIENIDTRLENIETDVENLQNEVDVVEDDIASLKGRMTNTEQGITDCLEQAADLRVELNNNVNEINERIDNIPEGKQGEPGEKGEQGEPGTAATIEIGTVETLPAGSQATVINSGTETNAVFNFRIPKGDTGEQGPEGKQGETGPAGPQGPAGSDAMPSDYMKDISITKDGTNRFLIGITKVENGQTAIYPQYGVIYFEGVDSVSISNNKLIVVKSGMQTEYDLPGALPTGAEGQILKMGYDGPEWVNETQELPEGGEPWDVLTKTNDGVIWAPVSGGGGGETAQPQAYFEIGDYANVSYTEYSDHIDCSMMITSDIWIDERYFYFTFSNLSGILQYLPEDGIYVCTAYSMPFEEGSKKLGIATFSVNTTGEKEIKVSVSVNDQFRSENLNGAAFAFSMPLNLKG